MLTAMDAQEEELMGSFIHSFIPCYYAFSLTASTGLQQNNPGSDKYFIVFYSLYIINVFLINASRDTGEASAAREEQRNVHS